MKKLTLLLASLGAGVLLVGGTVALNIVTSASPIGVQISPGTIHTDESHRIVLSWGKNTTAPVGNLVPEVETAVGEVELAAKENDAALAEPYVGIFSATLVDDTSYSGANLLSKYLSVKAYKYVTSEYSSTAAFTLTYGSMTASVNDARSGDAYLFKVTLNADPKAAYYSDLLLQQVTLTLNWGKAAGDTDVKSIANVYFAKPTAWTGENVYVYAYKDGNVLTTYPGLKMTYMYDIEGGKELYYAGFNREAYDHFIFNNGTHETDIEAAHVFAENEPTPYYNGSSWAGIPDEVKAKYYVRGTINGTNCWDKEYKELAFAENTSKADEWILNDLALYDGDKFKIYVPAAGDYFIAGEGDYEIRVQGDYHGVGTPGLYNIYVTDQESVKGESWITCTSDQSDTYYMYITKTAELPE